MKITGDLLRARHRVALARCTGVLLAKTAALLVAFWLLLYLIALLADNVSTLGG